MEEPTEPRAVPRAAIEAITELGHGVYDLASGRMVWSRQACRIFGFPCEANALPWLDSLASVHPQDRGAVAAALRQAVTRWEPFECRCRIVRPDGALRVIRMQGEAVGDRRGGTVQIIVTVLDLTKPAQNETVLPDESACLHALWHNPSIGIALFSADSRIQSTNQAFQDLVGYAAEELTGMACGQLTPAEDIDSYVALRRRIFEGTATGDTREKRYRRKDGRLIWIEITTSCVREADGRVRFGVVLAHEITARKQAEAAVQASEQRFRTLAETAPVGIFQTDRHGQTVYANPRLREILAPTTAHGLGPGWGKAVHPEDRARLAQARQSAVVQAQPVQIEYRLQHGDGAVSAVIEHACPLVEPDGRLRGWIGTLTDITPLHHKEIALRRAKAEADRATTAKSRFLAAASHDLRQPLQALLLFSEMLAQQNRNPALEPILGKMRDALATQQQMFTALLDISRLDSGTIEVEKHAFAVGPVIAHLAEQFAPQAVQHGLTLRSVASTAFVHSDPVLLERILRNLLSNAVTYTERGRILLGCRRAGALLRLQVWDTGPGIAAEQLESIFEEFHQLGPSAGDRTPGLGLGLAIVDRLVRLLDHRITVHSVVGKGTVFTVEVPAVSAGPKPPPAERPAVVASPASPGVITVIEDDRAVLEALQLCLEAIGYQVTAAGSAEQALELLHTRQLRPRVIVADYQLAPGQTGSAAIDRLRAAVGEPVPGIVLTGDTSPERLREAQARGFALLHKPIQPEQLRQAIERALHGQPGPADA